MLKKRLLLAPILVLAHVLAVAQHKHETANSLSIISGAEPQPMLAQATRLKETLSFLGGSLSKEDAKKLEALQHDPLTAKTTQAIQHILDKYCSAMVNINPEARVKVTMLPQKQHMIRHGNITSQSLTNRINKFN